MQLPSIFYKANQFTWTDRDGVTEASDIGARHGIPGGRIYDDAADWGFQVIGKEATILFTFTECLRDREGDLNGWKYVSDCGKFKITILND